MPTRGQSPITFGHIGMPGRREQRTATISLDAFALQRWPGTPPTCPPVTLARQVWLRRDPSGHDRRRDLATLLASDLGPAQARAVVGSQAGCARIAKSDQCLYPEIAAKR